MNLSLTSSPSSKCQLVTWLSGLQLVSFPNAWTFELREIGDRELTATNICTTVHERGIIVHQTYIWRRAKDADQRSGQEEVPKILAGSLSVASLAVFG